jgi:hypothetical protein
MLNIDRAGGSVYSDLEFDMTMKTRYWHFTVEKWTGPGGYNKFPINVS